MEWDEKSIRNAKDLARGPLGQELGKMPLRFAAGILIASRIGDGQHRIRTATSTLIDAGTGPLAVTCHHVLESYRNARGADSATTFQLGGLVFDPESRLISECRKQDLATISLAELDLDSISDTPGIGNTFFSPRIWPPTRVSPGAIVSIGGFPEQWRECKSMNEVVLPTFSVASVFVSSVSDDQFGVKLERDEWVSAFNYENREWPHEFSGLSGCPVVIERTDGVRRFEVVGVAKEFSESLDYVVAVHADSIGRDGIVSGSRPRA
jgi:hypothetical protein